MSHAPAAALDPLRARLHGELLLPADAGYDVARAVWNARLDPRPAAVVRCADAADVAAAITFARERGLPLSVKSGGHDYAGKGAAAGALALDLSHMNMVHVDAKTKTARVQPGATWGKFDAAAQEAGLATTGPTVSTVGVAGCALGGGSGHLARKLGLTLDNLLAVELVTADGRSVRADGEQNPELLWALRGAGANFGVATSFEFALHPVGPQVLAAQIVYPFERAREALRLYREFLAAAPDELTCYPFLIRVPPIAVFPGRFHGTMAIDLVVSWCGDLAAGEKAIAPLRALGEPILDFVAPHTYVELQKSFDAGVPKGLRWYSQAQYLRALPDAAVETMLEHTRELPGAFSMVYLEGLGGAIGRVAPDATAFPHRNAPYALHILPGWSDPGDDAAIMDWARRFHQAMSAYSTGGVYVNLLSNDEAARVPEAYGANYARLARLKREWDPENLLRSNQNIPPG